jgi:serine/threonine protein kinase
MAYLSLMSAPCLDDFTILRGLGDGSSGTVHLVRENDTGGLYALKAISKRKFCGKELKIEIVMAERNTLLDLRGDDFILQLRACFHDSRNYYLVTVREAILQSATAEMFVLTSLSQEYHPSGDLHTLLLLKGSPQNVVRFYMAELVRFLSYLMVVFLIRRTSGSSS